jgi:hypothetical protein
MAHEVFISHAHQDKTVADLVCAGLEAQGVSCWIAPRDIQVGADWGSAIVTAIRTCRAMVLVFSDHANASRHIPRELERAVDHEIPVIPFRIEDVQPRGALEYILSSVHWLDALTPPLEAHVDRLGPALRAIIGPAAAISPGPTVALHAGEMSKDLTGAVGDRPTDPLPRSAHGMDGPRPLAGGGPRQRAIVRRAIVLGVLIALSVLAAYALLNSPRISGRVAAGAAAPADHGPTTSTPNTAAPGTTTGAVTSDGVAGMTGQPASGAAAGSAGTASAETPPGAPATPSSLGTEPRPTAPAARAPSGSTTRSTRSAAALADQPASSVARAPTTAPVTGAAKPPPGMKAQCGQLIERESLGNPLTPAEQTFLSRECRN